MQRPEFHGRRVESDRVARGYTCDWVKILMATTSPTENTTHEISVEQAVVYSTLPQEYSTLTFREKLLLVVVEWKRGAK